MRAARHIGTAAALALALSGCTCAGPDGPDAGFEDAWGPDTFGPWPTPPEPELIWSAGIDTPCAELRTPVWTPTPRTGPPGTRRWVQSGGFPEPAMEQATFADGSVFYTPDFMDLFGIDLQTGVTWQAIRTPGPRPDRTGFQPGLLMTLGESLIVSADPFSLVYYDVRGARDAASVRRGTWLFPELEALVDRTRAFDTRLVPGRSIAWSPTAGTVAFTASTIPSSRAVAVQCTEADAGRFIVSFASPPADWTQWRTHLIYRENGELLVHYGALYVLGPRGELLRSTGLPPDSEPLAYTPECGLLYRQQATPWYLTWWDVDTMQPRQTFIIPIGSTGLSIYSRCRPVVWRNDGVWISESEVSVFPLGPEDRRQLRDGGSYAWGPDNEVILFDASGAETGRFTVQDYEPSSGSSTPEGDFVAPGVGYWELGLDRVPSGTLSTGLNWAHTNSPLPP
ncbi:MAG: hypothetical protein OHK0013_27690 [Sandaracinaceae bacterium]